MLTEATIHASMTIRMPISQKVEDKHSPTSLLTTSLEEDIGISITITSQFLLNMTVVLSQTTNLRVGGTKAKLDSRLIWQLPDLCQSLYLPRIPKTSADPLPQGKQHQALPVRINLQIGLLTS